MEHAEILTVVEHLLDRYPTDRAVREIRTVFGRLREGEPIGQILLGIGLG